MFVVSCMQEWLRDLSTSRLVRNTSLPLSQNPVMASLQERFYPIRTSLPSCIKLPKANGNNFELKSLFINTLPKFHSLESEDACFFVRKFEEVCLMLRIPQLGDDVIRLRFISIFLKDLAKKWMYSLAVWLCHNVGGFHQGHLEEILSNSQNCADQKEPHAVQIRIQWAFWEILWMIQRSPGTMPSLWHKKICRNAKFSMMDWTIKWKYYWKPCAKGDSCRKMKIRDRTSLKI